MAAILSVNCIENKEKDTYVVIVLIMLPIGKHAQTIIQMELIASTTKPVIATAAFRENV